MQVAYLLDPLARLDATIDSSVELIRAHRERGDEVFAVFRDGLTVTAGRLTMQAWPLHAQADDAAWYRLGEPSPVDAAEIDLIAVRLEPPVDGSFRIICQMLALAGRAGARVVNDPSAILLREEKLSAQLYSELMPRTLVSTDRAALGAFCADLAAGCVLKPLDGMGGRGVFAFDANDSNAGVAIDSILARGGTVLAQERLDVFASGDRRVFVIAGRPHRLMIKRTPGKGSHLANMIAGGEAEVMEITAAEEAIVERIGADLLAQGIVFAGIDVIAGKLTEINITCPTGLRFVREQTEVSVAASVIDAFKAHRR